MLYLPREEDVQSMIMGIIESLSSSDPGDQSSANPNLQIGRYLPNPNDNSKMLQINGALLPQNNDILLITASVSEFQK